MQESASSQENFAKFPPSSKRAILEWIMQAKTATTRKRRIDQTVSLAEQNIRANHYADRRSLKSKKVEKKVSTVMKVNSDLLNIPGIGKTFVSDFLRIGIRKQKDLLNKDALKLFQKLRKTNDKEGHKTSKNYLYVICMAIYYVEGGRDPKKLKWSAWKDLVKGT